MKAIKFIQKVIPEKERLSKKAWFGCIITDGSDDDGEVNVFEVLGFQSERVIDADIGSDFWNCGTYGLLHESSLFDTREEALKNQIKMCETAIDTQKNHIKSINEMLKNEEG